LVGTEGSASVEALPSKQYNKWYYTLIFDLRKRHQNKEKFVSIGPIHHRRNGKAPTLLMSRYFFDLNHLIGSLQRLVYSNRRRFSPLFASAKTAQPVPLRSHHRA
jgi:hypothetical protein